MDRPRTSVYIAVSLDGYIARSDGRLDWLQQMETPGEDYGYGSFFSSVDSVIVGRSTWEHATGFSPWPYEGKHVVVLTSRPAEPTRGEVIASGGFDKLLSTLHAADLRHVQFDGGKVIRQALAARVVDDLTVSIVPRLLGNGIRLFGRGLPDLRLQLVGSETYPSGLVQLRYRFGQTGRT